MVEFGLKLEDNKVDKWSTNYIDYEKLKAILKRAKSGVEYRDELRSRTPAAVVAEVEQERRIRAAESTASLMSGQVTPPVPMTVSIHNGKKEGEEEGGVTATTTAGAAVTEDTPLLSKNNTTTSADTNNNFNFNNRRQSGDISDSVHSHRSSLKRNDSFSSHSHLKNNINKTVFKVTSYLGLANEKAMLLQAYEDVDDKLLLFERTYNSEVAKVTEFYADKIQDITGRMEALRADTSFLQEGVEKKRRGEEEKMNKRTSIVANMKNAFESIMKGSPHRHNLSSVAIVDSVEEEEEEDTENLRTFTWGDEEFNSTPTRKVGNAKDKVKGDEESLRRKLDLDSIKRAMDDIYRTAKLLHNYSIMNYTGFVKIAKKFDKAFKEHKGLFKGNNCDDGKKAEVLAGKMEELYANWFCDGDIREATAQMLTKRGDGLMMDWTQLRLGYRLGMCSILALWIAWDCVWGQLSRGEVSIGGQTAFPVFRGCFGLLAWHWFWGLSVFVWTRYRINYIYLFEFDPRNVDTPIDIFNDAVDETLVFLVCMLLYYKTQSDDQLFPNLIPPGAYPVFLILYSIKCLIFPWKMRKPLWISIRKVLMASFVSPTFFLTFVGDVFTR